MSRLAVSALALACAGCVSHSTVSRSTAGEERVVGRYIGFVEVTAPGGVPGEPPGVSRRSVKVLGGWVETSSVHGGLENAGVGWREGRQLVVPRECRLIVIVRSAEELDSARAMLSADMIAKGDLCVIQD
jgi:hypothetical protein